MKIYIDNIDWADEGDVLFCSIESELSYGCLISYKGINENMTEEGMIKIRNLYIELFSEKNWKDVEEAFNKSRNQ